MIEKIFKKKNLNKLKYNKFKYLKKKNTIY